MFSAEIVVESLSPEDGAETVSVPFLKIEAPSGSLMEPLTDHVVNLLGEMAEASSVIWEEHRQGLGDAAIAFFVAAAQSRPRAGLVSAEYVPAEPASDLDRRLCPEDFGGSDYGEMF